MFQCIIILLMIDNSQRNHTALMMACDSGHPDVARKLIQADAKLNLRDQVLE